MIRYKLIVKGLVQGVGFRPYVAGLAKKLSIKGNVYNAGGIVYINGISGEDAMNDLIYRLMLLDGNNDELPLADVTDFKLILPKEYEDKARQNSDYVQIGEDDEFLNEASCTSFDIVTSKDDINLKRILPIDIATCKECERQLFDPDNRRYRYPFISCASCGPRYSLMYDVPYDREQTSMNKFNLCPECEAEYKRIGDERCYAQTIACDTCGPKLTGYDKDGNTTYKEEAFKQAITVLKSGGIVAIKEPAGYHIAFDADNVVHAGLRLREYKNRENKPFAVMYESVDAIRKDCVLSDKEEALLTNEARPIVLLQKIEGTSFKDEDVIKGSNRIGAMLPSNPLQLLIMREFKHLVMTSGNISGMPVAVDDNVMISGLKEGYIDYVLSNDRDILYGLDDSVVQVVKGHTQFIRRSRGYVPLPVKLHGRRIDEVRLSLGGDMKSSFAYGIEDMVYPGGYYGDIKDYDSALRRESAIVHLGQMLGLGDGYIRIGDMHPEYESAKGADIKVQHHYAHILSVMAEHGLKEALGASFDGTGYGDDGSVWGGEFLICDDEGYKRVGRIGKVRLIGGDMSAKECDKTAMCFVKECEKRGLIKVNPFAGDDRYRTLCKAIDAGFNTIESTSAGRLFDAVSAILDVCLINTYESEAPVMLEISAEEYIKEHEEKECPDIKCVIRFFDNGRLYVADTVRLFADVLRLKSEGYEAGAIAYSFHRALADMVVDMFKLIYDNHRIYGVPVALSGGTMNNRLLLSMIMDRLDERGYKYYINEQVEAGDGGITLGQMLITTQ